MGVRGLRLLLVSAAALVAEPVEAQGSGAVPAPVSASVLLAPVQGSARLREQGGRRVAAAVRRSLSTHGFQVPASQELLGQTVVACQTPDCIEQALDAAGAAFAIVPAIWSRESGGEEVTLTLVRRSGGSLNATGVAEGELSRVTAELVEELLARAGTAASGTGTGAGAVTVPVTVTATGRGRAHAWKAGPAVLIGGGVATFVAIGVGAGVLNDNQQLNGSAVAVWATVGAAAIGGGIAWWVVGERRRRKNGDSMATLAPELAFQATKIDLRLRF